MKAPTARKACSWRELTMTRTQRIKRKITYFSKKDDKEYYIILDILRFSNRELYVIRRLLQVQGKLHKVTKIGVGKV